MLLTAEACTALQSHRCHDGRSSRLTRLPSVKADAHCLAPQPCALPCALPCATTDAHCLAPQPCATADAHCLAPQLMRTALRHGCRTAPRSYAVCSYAGSCVLLRRQQLRTACSGLKGYLHMLPWRARALQHEGTPARSHLRAWCTAARGCPWGTPLMASASALALFSRTLCSAAQHNKQRMSACVRI